MCVEGHVAPVFDVVAVPRDERCEEGVPAAAVVVPVGGGSGGSRSLVLPHAVHVCHCERCEVVAAAAAAAAALAGAPAERPGEQVFETVGAFDAAAAARTLLGELGCGAVGVGSARTLVRRGGAQFPAVYPAVVAAAYDVGHTVGHRQLCAVRERPRVEPLDDLEHLLRVEVEYPDAGVVGGGEDAERGGVRWRDEHCEPRDAGPVVGAGLVRVHGGRGLVDLGLLVRDVEGGDGREAVGDEEVHVPVEGADDCVLAAVGGESDRSDEVAAVEVVADLVVDDGPEAALVIEAAAEEEAVVCGVECDGCDEVRVEERLEGGLALGVPQLDGLVHGAGDEEVVL